VAEHTSARAALDFAAAGLPGVKALKGGISAWVTAGNPLVTGK
jgi:rhodanese-related sulfurtransferase